jgi:hypothetical protein
MSCHCRKTASGLPTGLIPEPQKKAEYMTLKDIIRTDSDRLFHVDPECYILFTGDSVHDEQPFIRIGNWIDMPVELIPLIENIIITDGIVGNPGHEQFNIDVRVLSTNRYIGSENIVRRYLDFQKLFGLDLTNATIVNIEKDIPELSKEKNISENSQFIGVFYRDGNFRTVHDGVNIIDLKASGSASLTRDGIHERLIEQARGSEAYSGSGLVIMEHNPLFYHNGSFVSYLLPSGYIETFSRLMINPLKIRSVIYPSGNYINVSSFLKWKHNRQDRLSVFSDRPDDIQTIRNLYRNINIQLSPFSGMKYGSGDGLSIHNYAGSFNLRLDFRGREGKGDDISIAFIKAATGIKQALREQLDAIITEYSAYEESALLFKSTSTPVMIINDSGSEIRGRLGQNIILLHPGLQYNFRKLTERGDIFSRYAPDLTGLLSGDTEALQRELEKKEEDGSLVGRIRRFNALSLLRLMMNTTTDRKLFQQIRKLHQDLAHNASADDPLGETESLHVDMVFHDSQIYQFAIERQNRPGVIYLDGVSIPDSSPSFHGDSGQMLQNDRIMEDRLRLLRLLSLFREEGILKGEKLSRETQLLKMAIEKRREHYARDLHLHAEGSTDGKGTGLTGLVKKALAGNAGSASGDVTSPPASGSPAEDYRDEMSRNPGTGRGRISGLRKLALPLGGLLVLLVIISMILMHRMAAKKAGPAEKTGGKNSSAGSKGGVTDDLAGTGFTGEAAKEVKPSDSILTKNQIEEYQSIPAEFRTAISDGDIYRYANRVALRNGYRELSAINANLKNPDWIYPSNTFIMLDETRITVVPGDTLWNISKKKLIEMDLNFYNTVKEIKKASGAEKEYLLKKIRVFSFSGKHESIIRSLR